jgi:outer membrane murein-binding lipoprotein Lpp
MWLLIAIILALTIISVAGVIGWARVNSAYAIAHPRGDQPDPLLRQRIEELAAAVEELQSQVAELTARREVEFQELEERVDFAERLLTKARAPE